MKEVIEKIKEEKFECRKCHKLLNLDKFSKCKNNNIGHKYSCKVCNREREYERKSGNPIAFFTDVIRTQKQQLEKRGISEYELECNFLADLFVQQNGKCALSGVDMTLISGKGKIATNASVDRIDGSKGYTKNNVQLVCLMANMCKGTGSNEDFNSFIKNAYEYIYMKKNVGNKDGWISVDERLPEEHDSIFKARKGTDKWKDAMFEKISDEVIVTVEYENGERRTKTTHTIDGEWNTGQSIVPFKVIAWQPLPASYKAEGE